jgi:hypothetical protein
VKSLQKSPIKEGFMKAEEGKNVWIFPDGDLPKAPTVSGLEAHEALMVLNTSDEDANLKLTIYFSDRDPIENISQVVQANRVKCIRMDHPDEIGGAEIPYRTQYALRVESDVKVVATFGRLDTTSEKMAYYTASCYSC